MARKVGLSVVLRQDQIEWLENQDGSISENVRNAIDDHAGLDDE